MLRQPDRLLRFILGWTTVTLLFVWLPLIRGVMDGPSYVWGSSYWGITVGGAGLAGHYWLLVVQGTIGLSILWLGWRRPRPPFHWLLLIWHGVFGTDAIYSSISNPERYRFRGDTLGIDVSLAWAGPLLFGGFFVLAIVWAVQDVRRRARQRVPSLPRWNTPLLAGLLLLLPLQFILFRFGQAHGITDQIGVILTIGQCLLLGEALKPRHRAG